MQSSQSVQREYNTKPIDDIKWPFDETIKCKISEHMEAKEKAKKVTFPQDYGFKCYDYEDKLIDLDCSKCQDWYALLQQDQNQTENNSSQNPLCLFQDCKALFRAYDQCGTNLANVVWLLELSQAKKIVSFKLQSEIKGSINEALVADITFEDNTSKKVLIKQMGERMSTDNDFIVHNQKWRELGFYRDVCPEKLSGVINYPNPLLTVAHPETQSYILVLEFLEEGCKDLQKWVDEFKDLQSQLDKEENQQEIVENLAKDKESLINSVIKELAKMHAATWNDQSLLKYDYLGHANWLKHEDEDQWKKAYKTRTVHHHDMINLCGEQRMFEENHRAMSLLTTRMNKCNFKDYVKSLQTNNFALCHADAIPRNYMWNKETKEITMIDFEFVRIGNPLQDFVFLLNWLRELHSPFISGLPSREERINATMKSLLQYLPIYHQELCNYNKSLQEFYSFEDCKKDFIQQYAIRMLFSDLGGYGFEEKNLQRDLKTLEDFANLYDITEENINPFFLYFI